MNSLSQRGVLFTFLTFLMVGLVVSVIVFSVDVNNRSARNTVDISVLNAINAKYDDITDDIITLDHPIGVPSIRQRIFPFTYSIDANIFHVNQTIPISSGKLESYFDLIHAYRIFVMDEDANNTYDGVNVTLDLPIPPGWGGAASGANFNILPQCVQYSLLDENAFHFESSSELGCANGFDISISVQRIDINLSFPTPVDDYNRLTCSVAGDSNCFNVPFDPDSPYPYISIQMDDTNCADCDLSASEKLVQGHFDPEFWNSITYSCSGSSCVSEDITIQFGEGIRFTHDSTPVLVQMDVTFVETISTFYYQDANYSVQKPGFDTYKSNAVVFPT